MFFVKYFKKHANVDLAYFKVPTSLVESKIIFRNEYFINPSVNGRTEISPLRRLLKRLPQCISNVYSLHVARELKRLIHQNLYD